MGEGNTGYKAFIALWVRDDCRMGYGGGSEYEKNGLILEIFRRSRGK